MTTVTFLSAMLVMSGLAGSVAGAQTYVTPMMGGGQVAADMVHIDLYYDADANQFQAHVDDSFGTPELRALTPGFAFDPAARYAVLNGKAYNAQYGWNAGGFFTIPAGAAIWIEQTNGSPGLEVYQDWGRLGSYTPIFGTGGSSRRWKWSGVMVHNSYAIRSPVHRRYSADYHIYFGDATTGSRTGFSHLGDTTVHLEWTTVPLIDPSTFLFGAAGPTNGAPLQFLNAASFVTDAGFVVNFRHTNAGPCASLFEGGLPMMAVAATTPNGGPVTNHAALGSCVELELLSLAGPPGARLSFWETGEAQPRFSVPAGERFGTNRFHLSQSRGTPGADPFGDIQGRRFALDQAGLYRLEFRLVDTSTNGPGGGPVHLPSAACAVYLQAGLTVNALTQHGGVMTACFAGESGRTFYLERAGALSDSSSWQTVAGPLTGTNALQTLTDALAPSPQGFYRLRADHP